MLRSEIGARARAVEEFNARVSEELISFLRSKPEEIFTIGELSDILEKKVSKPGWMSTYDIITSIHAKLNQLVKDKTATIDEIGTDRYFGITEKQE